MGIKLKYILASITIISILVALVFTHPLLASQNKSQSKVEHKGLLIAPIREYTDIDAGTKKRGFIVIANHTKNPMDVVLKVEEFSVADYSYDYRFSKAKKDWIKLSQNFVKLKPAESKTIDYDLQIPIGTAPGGSYFTIFATTDFITGGIKSEVQAASNLYVTVKGELDRSSILKDEKINNFVFGASVPFELDIQNIGNTHYFAHIKAQLNGLFTDKSQITASHIVLPDTTRRINNAIPAPLLPGIYEAVYGYTIEGKPQVQKSTLIIYLPPWSWVLIIFLGFLGFKFWQSKRRPSKPKSKDAQPPTPNT